MSTEDLGDSLSPEENSYFETSGATAIPQPDAADGEGTAGASPADAPPGRADPADVAPRAEKMVALEALHEERKRRREIDQHNRALQQELAELRGRFSVIERLRPAPEPEAPLTPETDIFGYARRTGDTLEQLQRRLDARDEAERASALRHQLVSAYRADAAAFEARTPDFRQAYDHLLRSRVAELQAMGFDDPEQLQQAVQADEYAVAEMALARGRSAAETIYALAQQRGWQPAGGGKDAAAARIETIGRGQAANKSLSAAGGPAGDGDMTAEALIRMPMDEFETWVSRNPKRARRLMGG